MLERIIHGVLVRGVSVDEQTRCHHYHSERDVIALRFACCDAYYPCHACHDETAGHPAIVWPQERFVQPSILCGSCGHQLSLQEYLACDSACPRCSVAYNPGCKAHLHLYFDMQGAGM